MTIQVDKSHYFKKKYLTIHRFISYFYQIDSIRTVSPQTILFIGVGDGIVSNFLKKHPLYEVTTLDIDPALEPDVVGDVRSLSFPDNTYDLVCAFEVLEHLPLSEANKAVAEMVRVTRESLLISIPHRRSGIEVAIRFPFIRSLLKREFVRIAIRVPVRFGGFAKSKQHYWEIDGRTTKLKDIRNLLRMHGVIRSEHTPVLDFYLRFFNLRKHSQAE